MKTMLTTLTKKDYSFYKKQSYWKYIECIGLIIGKKLNIDISPWKPFRDPALKIQNPEVFDQISDIRETMKRSIGDDLLPREDYYGYMEINIDDLTFTPKHFIDWARSKGYEIFFNEQTDSNQAIEQEFVTERQNQDSISCKPDTVKIQIESGNTKDAHIFARIKELDCWTLNEGIGLLTKPVFYLDQFNGPSFDEFANDVLCKIDLRVFYRGIDAGNLKVIGYDEKKIKNWDFEKSSPIQYSNDQNYHNCQAEYWRDCYGNLKANPFEFLEFVKEKQLFEIPSELKYTKNESKAGETQYCWGVKKNERVKPLRPDQEDKIACQKIGEKIWKEYPILDIVHLKKHPEIKEITGSNYSLYKQKTIHKWLSEIAPENARAPGKRPKKIQEQQKKICERIGIKL